MKSWHKIAAVSLVAVGLVIAGVLGQRRGASSDEMFTRLSDRLMCQCGCGQHLQGCNMHPCGSAYPMRDQVRASTARGNSEEEIVEQFVQQMGAGVLATPPARGIGLAAWIMPVVALLLGLAVIFRVVKRWRPQPAGERGGPPASTAAPSGALASDTLRRHTASIDEELEREA